MLASKKNMNQTLSSSSTPVFFTLGLLIFDGIHFGLFFGAATTSVHPLYMWIFFVPLSLNLNSTGFDFVPLLRLAAFKAAWRGWCPVNTPASFPFFSLNTKFLISAIISSYPDNVLLS